MLSTFVMFFGSSSIAQKCEIISMDHIGGNVVEQVAQPGIVAYPNGYFSITVEHNSSAGSIKTDCNTMNGSMVFVNCNAAATISSQSCVPKKGVGFQFPTFYVYPQPNGDTVIIGQRNSDATSHDIGIERRDAAGNVLWTKFYGGSGSDGLSNVAEADDGGFFIAVGTNSTDGDVGMHYGSTFTADIWVLRVDNNGDMLWGKVLGGTSADLPRDIHTAADGGCYVFGVTASSDYDATGNHGSSDLYIVKLDSLGHKDWHKCLGGSGDDGSGYDFGIKAIPDHNDGYYVLNRTASHDGDVQHRMPDGIDFWLLHIDSAGNILWETTFGGPSDQYPSALCRGGDGSLWMGGYFYGGTTPGGMIDITYGNTDGWIVHADSLGNFINQRVLGSDQVDAVKELFALADGTVFAVGEYYKFYNNTNMPRSPGFPEQTEGDQDIFMARLGPQTVSIKERGNNVIAWDLFPNPADEAVKIKVSGGDQNKYEISVTDMAGKLWLKRKFKTATVIDVKGFKSGEHIFRITDKDGQSSTRTLTIKH